jgi:hypothetical protein
MSNLTKTAAALTNRERQMVLWIALRANKNVDVQPSQVGCFFDRGLLSYDLDAALAKQPGDKYKPTPTLHAVATTILRTKRESLKHDISGGQCNVLIDLLRAGGSIEMSGVRNGLVHALVRKGLITSVDVSDKFRIELTPQGAKIAKAERILRALDKAEAKLRARTSKPGVSKIPQTFLACAA